MKEKIIIVGGGGHARIVIDIIGRMNVHDIEAIVVDKIANDLQNSKYKVYEGDHHLKNLIDSGINKAAIGVGGFRDNLVRKKIFKNLKSLGFKIVNVIDPSAFISETVFLAEGVVVFPGVIINTDAFIGNNVIIATGSTIDHETIIEDHCLVSAGVTIGGYCKIGESALIALGAKIVSGVTIGKNSLVAAGAVVVKNVEDNCQVFGVPAKIKYK